MNPVIDYTIVTVLVAISTVIAVYTISPIKAKRWMLSKASRFISIRVIKWLLPNQCGCDGCPVRDETTVPRAKPQR